jgi:hypothetical protein
VSGFIRTLQIVYCVGKLFQPHYFFKKLRSRLLSFNFVLIRG